MTKKQKPNSETKSKAKDKKPNNTTQKRQQQTS